jgi:hypothetical protein
MLVKTGIAAVVLIAAAVGLSRVDFRELYDQMYPVNGLKRDVLVLCHQARPTFIRAIEADRVGCYDSMPDNIDLAIGWVRTSDRLAALRKTPTPVEQAERLLSLEIVPGARPGMPQFTGYMNAPVVHQPCAPTSLAAVPAGTGPAFRGSDESLARRIATGDAATLAALGLPSAQAHNPGSKEAMPALPLGSSGPSASTGTLGDDTIAVAPATGCKTPA